MITPESVCTPDRAGGARGGEVLAVRRRRGALRVAVGPRLPPVVPGLAARGAGAGAAAGPRADRDRDAGDRRRHPGPARDEGREGLPRLVPPPEPGVRRAQGRGRSRQAAPARQADPAAAAPGHRLLRDGARGRGALRGAPPRQDPGRALPRQDDERRARGVAGVVHAARAQGRHARDQRVRPRHRQAGHPLRHPLPHARLARGVRPGGGARGPRRQAGALRAAVPARRRRDPGVLPEGGAPDQDAGAHGRRRSLRLERRGQGSLGPRPGAVDGAARAARARHPFGARGDGRREGGQGRALAGRRAAARRASRSTRRHRCSRRGESRTGGGWLRCWRT